MSRLCWEKQKKKQAAGSLPSPQPRHFTAARGTRCTGLPPGRQPALPRLPGPMPSQMGQWPCQIKLVPVNAPYFDGAKLLIGGGLHGLRLRQPPSGVHAGRITLIGCPKLDGVDYSEKADRDPDPERHPERHRPADGSALLRRSGTGCRPCFEEQRKIIPWQVVTFSAGS